MLYSKFNYPGVPAEDHRTELTNTIKTAASRHSKLWARTLFRVFKAHQDLHDAHSSDLKTMNQLDMFPHQ
jgi:hypothetical protein